MIFTLNRTGDLSGSVSVGYTTVSGTAQAGSDFTPQTGSVTFAAGSPTATVAVPIIGDTLVEGNEQFTLQLTGVLDTFGAPPAWGTSQTFATATLPWRVILGDLNGDGRPDAIVTNEGSASISLFLNTTSPGTGTPSFGAKQDFATAAGPSGVALGDINGDGRLDLVVTHATGNTVSIFLNTTTPGATTLALSTAATLTTAANPQRVALGDINGDGRPDLVVAQQDGNSVGLFRNTTAAGASSPSFATRQDVATANGPAAVVLADFNGDGRLDIATANRTANNVSVLLNSTAINATTFNFAASSSFAVQSTPLALIAADLNGDGRADLAVANSGSNTVSVLVNNTTAGASTPSFQAAQHFATGTAPVDLAVAELNGDGHPDLVVTNRDANSVSVLANRTITGSSTIALATKVDTTLGNQPTGLALGDLNGDGRVDLVAVNRSSGTLASFNNATTFPSTVPSFSVTGTALANAGRELAVGDLNGDGKLDLVAAVPTGNQVAVLLNTTPAGATSASFATRLDLTSAGSPFTVTVADVNRDGMPDLIVSNFQGNSFSVFLNATVPGASTATFAARQDFATLTNPYQTAVGDLNGDGLLDLVVSNRGNNNVSVFLNTTTPGSSTVTYATRVDFSMTNAPHGVILADLNGDGRLDIVAANQGTGNGNTISVRLNTTTAGASAPSFASKQDFTVGTAPRSITILDVNGDGKPDVAVANRVSNDVSILINTTATNASSATFAAAQNVAAGTQPYALRSADVNGDGRPDLVASNRGSNQAVVLINTTALGSSTIGFTSSTITLPAASFGLAVGDFNGDRIDDLVFSDDANATLRTLITARAQLGEAFQATGTILDDEPPVVVSIDRLTPATFATNATSVTYSIVFSQSVTGFSAADVVVIPASGVQFAGVEVQGSGTTYQVTITGITGEGNLQLDVLDDDSVVQLNGIPLGGAGLGNGAAAGPTYLIDVTAPNISSARDRASNAAGWYRDNVTITFSGSDFLSGLDFLTAPITVSTEGAGQSVQGMAVDQAGNVATTGDTINLDKTPPLLTYSLDRSPNANGWFNADVIVTFQASDSLSGLLGFSSPVVVSSEGANQPLSGQATDIAENVATVQVLGLNIDKTAPVIQAIYTTAPNGAYGVGATIPITVEFSEPVTLTGGSLIFTLDNGGTFTIPAFATLSTTAVGFYTVQAGQGSPDLDTVSVLLTGGQLVDIADNPAMLAIPVADSLADRADLQIVSSPTLSFQLAQDSRRESAGSVTVVVQLSAGLGSTLNVPVVVSGTATSGADYTISSTTLTFPAGSTSATLVVTLLDDHLSEPTETIVLALQPVAGAALGANTQMIISILDNDVPRVVVEDLSIFEGDSGTTLATVVATRVGDLSQEISFSILTTNGTAVAPGDYATPSGPLTIPGGASIGQFQIAIVGDTTIELDETFTFQLTGLRTVIGPAPSWTSSFEFTTGVDPFGIALGDLNLDGLPDIVTADFTDGTLSIFRNTTSPGSTTPTLAARQTFSASSSVFDVQLVDLNRDGLLDLVATVPNDNTILVRLNTTTPGATTFSFAPAQTFATGVNPQRVVIGDFNGDGRADLAVVNAGSNTLGVFLNTTTIGASTVSLAAQQTFVAPTFPAALAVGDFNGDGRVDLAVTSASAGTLALFINTTTAGSSTFTFSRQDVALAQPLGAITTGDLNRDGRPDLAIVQPSGGAVLVLLNNTVAGAGSLTFAAPQNVSLPWNAQDVRLADLNRDGALDLLVVGTGANQLAVLDNRTPLAGANVAFQSAQLINTPSNPQFAAIGDLNLDGRLDLFVTSLGAEHVSVVLNQTFLDRPLLAPAAVSATAEVDPGSVVSADFNGDGLLDVVVANEASGTVTIFRQTSTSAAAPSLAAAQHFTMGNQPTAVAVGDFNGDGLPDLVAVNRTDGTITVRLNTSTPGSSTFSFAAAQTFSVGTQPRDIVLGDFNGDGRLDVAVANQGSNNVTIRLNETPAGASTVNFSSAVNVATAANPVALTVGDLNRDGRADLIVAAASGVVSLLRNTTAAGGNVPSFAATQNVNVGTQPVAVAVGDVNGDGIADVVVGLGGTAQASILLNTTAANATTFGFRPVQNLTLSAFATDVVLADFNGDGRLDLAASVVGGTAALFLNRTTPSGTTIQFDAPLAWNLGATANAIVAADFNRDGFVDLARSSATSDNVALILAQPVVTDDATATITILDDDGVLAQMQTASVSVNESIGTITLIVQLSIASQTNVSIPFSVTSGTASAGADYTLMTSPLVILAGQLTGAITVSIINDSVHEGNETFTVTLGTPQGAGVGPQASTQVTILDDDAQPNIRFATTSQTVGEAAGAINVVVTLSAASAQNVTVPILVGGTATPSADFTLGTSSITILAGNTSAVIPLTIIDDLLDEANETVVLSFGAPTNATIGTPSTYTLTINDNDPPPTVSLVGPAAQTISENVGTLSYTIVLSAVSGQAVTIPYTLAGNATSGSDYTVSPASPLVIPAGQTSASIQITIIDDTVSEGTEQILFNLGTPTNASLGSATSATISITDNDLFGISGSTLSVAGTNGNDALLVQFTSPTNFNVELNGISQGFSTSTINNIQLNGLNGTDTLRVILPSSSDVITLRQSTGTIIGIGYQLQFSNIENKYVFGGSNDTAELFDSAGDDVFAALPSYSLIFAPGYISQVIGVGSVTGRATLGGLDTALYYDSPGNDTFSVQVGSASMTGPGVLLSGTGFKFSYGYASTGVDTAFLADAPDDNLFYGTTGFSVISGNNYAAGAVGFDSVTATASVGNDQAYLIDSPGNDTFLSTPTSSTMTAGGVVNRADNFKVVFAFGFSGGTDTVNLTDSAGDDLFQGDLLANGLGRLLYQRSALGIPTSTVEVSFFRQLNVSFTLGGNDVAALSDSPGNDTLTLNANEANFSGNNYSHRIVGSKSLFVTSVFGTDAATINDSAGNDFFQAAGNQATINYAAAFAQLTGFRTVQAIGTAGGVNTRRVQAHDYALTFQGSWIDV